MTPRLLVFPPADVVGPLPPPDMVGPVLPADRAAPPSAGQGPPDGASEAPWLALVPGAASLLTTLATPATAREGLVAWLAGQRGPWRRRRVQLDGRAIGHRRAAARVRAGMVTIAPPELAAEVSVADHLAAVASPRRVSQLLAEVPTLAGRGPDPAGVLSGGERQMVAWARAALAVPRVVVLDRAGTGLDPAALAWATDTLRRWRAAGCVVLVCAGRPEETSWLTVTRPDGRDPGTDGCGPERPSRR